MKRKAAGPICMKDDLDDLRRAWVGQLNDVERRGDWISFSFCYPLYGTCSEQLLFAELHERRVRLVSSSF